MNPPRASLARVGLRQCPATRAQRLRPCAGEAPLSHDDAIRAGLVARRAGEVQTAEPPKAAAPGGKATTLRRSAGSLLATLVRGPDKHEPRSSVSRETRCRAAECCKPAGAGPQTAGAHAISVKREVRPRKVRGNMVFPGTNRLRRRQTFRAPFWIPSLSRTRKRPLNARIQPFRPPKWGPDWVRSSPAPTRRVA